MLTLAGAQVSRALEHPLNDDSDPDVSAEGVYSIALWVAKHALAIRRALRLAELVDNPSCAFLDDLRQVIGCETHTAPRILLSAIREAVK